MNVLNEVDGTRSVAPGLGFPRLTGPPTDALGWPAPDRVSRETSPSKAEETISEGLALKTSLQLLYDAQPANIPVPLFNAGGVQTGTVSTESDEIDRVVTLTLVVRF